MTYYRWVIKQWVVEMQPKEMEIVAFCIDVRGYKQLLATSKEELAAILVEFIAYVKHYINQMPHVRQVSVQGDAIICVCEIVEDTDIVTVWMQLMTLVSEQYRLKDRLMSQSLSTIQFGIGIDCGYVYHQSTCIEAPHGDLYVGGVISQAIRCSDHACRPPKPYAVIVTPAVSKRLSGKWNLIETETRTTYFGWNSKEKK